MLTRRRNFRPPRLALFGGTVDHFPTVVRRVDSPPVVHSQALPNSLKVLPSSSPSTYTPKFYQTPPSLLFSHENFSLVSINLFFHSRRSYSWAQLPSLLLPKDKSVSQHSRTGSDPAPLPFPGQSPREYPPPSHIMSRAHLPFHELRANLPRTRVQVAVVVAPEKAKCESGLLKSKISCAVSNIPHATDRQ